jgi:hypothetical protein
VSFEIGVLLAIVGFLAFLVFLNQYLPAELHLISNFDITALGIGFTAITASCVIATGIPCGIAVAIGAILAFVNIAVNFTVFKIFFTAMTFILLYIVLKLARGVD